MGLGSAHTAGRSAVDNGTAAGAALRSHVDNPVGFRDHIKIVFNHDDGIAGVD